jgi:hypothetical protein
MFSSGLRKILPLGALALIFAVTAGIGHSRSPSPAGPSPTGSPGYDRKLLKSEFKQAQGLELKAFERKEKNEANAMNASQKSRRSDFERTERTEREKFFKDVHTGAEKRVYVKSMLDRREDLKKSLADEKAKYQKDAEERLEALVDDQQRKRDTFDESLKRGDRPADTLWPQPGIMSEPSPNK